MSDARAVLSTADLEDVKRPRQPRVATGEKGWQLIPCPGCKFVLRSHPVLEELDAQVNWTRTCASCLKKLCITCYPVGAEMCVRCADPTQEYP